MFLNDFVEEKNKKKNIRCFIIGSSPDGKLLFGL